MKNLINYYYNLLINEFKRVGDHFLFEIENDKYEFLPFEYNIRKFEKIYAILVNNNKYCHEIIINKENSMLTFYNEKMYILLKKNLYIDSEVTFEDILNYDEMIFEDGILNWKKLWKEKIDYYEYQISQLGFKYKLLGESISYYIGLSELAINLLNFVDMKNIKFYICHKRINFNDKLDSIFNPLNIVVDNKTRDIGEFLKSQYINNCMDINQTILAIEKVSLDYNESILLLARLIYPSYYFDMYDEIIQEKISEIKINEYIKKNVCYETFVKSVYKYLKVKYNIVEVECLEN